MGLKGRIPRPQRPALHDLSNDPVEERNLIQVQATKAKRPGTRLEPATFKLSKAGTLASPVNRLRFGQFVSDHKLAFLLVGYGEFAQGKLSCRSPITVP
jgi:hypothetical protein